MDEPNSDDYTENVPQPEDESTPVDCIVRSPVDECPACRGTGLIETWCDDNDYLRVCAKCQCDRTVERD